MTKLFDRVPAPPWCDGGAELRRVLILCAFAALWSLIIPLRMLNLWQNFQLPGPDAVNDVSTGLTYFTSFTRSYEVPALRGYLLGAEGFYGLAGFAIIVAYTPVLAVTHYIGHLQGARSDYTMRRLPKRSEYHVRCLASPILGLAAAAVGALILAAVYALCYHGLLLPAVERLAQAGG